MLAVQNVVAWSILILIVSGAFCSVLSGRASRFIAHSVSLIVGIMNVMLTMYFINGGDSFTYSMGHYGAPVGNELRSGALEAATCAIFSFIMFFSLLGGRAHIDEEIKGKKINLYYISCIFLLCSMLALVNTNDLFTAYVFIEINTITACGIILAKEGKQTLAAATRYLIMSLVGSGLFLIAVCIMYGATGHLLMEPIREYISANIAPGSREMLPVQVSMGLFTVGIALKSALWPFHSWLPEAHSSATIGSSAMLSGLVLKAYIFLLIKIYYRVLGLDLMSASPIFDIVLVVGAAAMVMGSVSAVREKDLKRMLAYSSVGQIGYIYLGLGMNSLLGIEAAMMQVLVHAVTKAMLFLSSGGCMDASGGSKKFKDINGAGKRDPLSGAAFFVGSMSMIGIPFFAGFIVKLSLVNAAIELGGWRMYLSFVAIVLSTVLTAVYYLMALGNLFGGENNSTKPKDFKYRIGYVIALAVFIIVNVAIGIGSDRLVELVQLGFGMFA